MLNLWLEFKKILKVLILRGLFLSFFFFFSVFFFVFPLVFAKRSLASAKMIFVYFLSSIFFESSVI